jgi:hypothetical protein
MDHSMSRRRTRSQVEPTRAARKNIGDQLQQAPSISFTIDLFGVSAVIHSGRLFGRNRSSSPYSRCRGQATKMKAREVRGRCVEHSAQLKRKNVIWRLTCAILLRIMRR